MFKKLLLIFGSLTPLLLILLFVVARPSFITDSQPVMFTVSKGSALNNIAHALAEQGILHSPKTFSILALLTGSSKSLKEGIYLLEKGHYWGILVKLSKGRVYRIKVTIPEGWTSYQIGEKLKRSGILNEVEPFVLWVKKKRLEGWLFPETYFFPPKADAKMVAKEMVLQFKKIFSPEFKLRAKKLRLTERKAVTLASIIEREAQVDAERVIISSVYHNRLKKRWLLEADPTVQYAISGGGFWKDRLTYKDLKVDSPYNTYRKRGLPPGPICNPGLKSLHAALHPAKTEFLFFVADGTGGHSFFRTYKEHLKARDVFRERRKKQARKKTR